MAVSNNRGQPILIGVILEKIARRIDIVFCVTGLIIATILALITLLHSSQYFDYVLMLIGSCGTYLALRNRLHIEDEVIAISWRPISYSLTTFSFILTLTGGFLALHFSLYGRNLEFFALIPFISGIAAFEIISFPLTRKVASLLLGKMFGLFLLIRLSLFQQFPSSVLGVDPWSHLNFLLTVVSVERVPAGYQYSGFPSMHLASAVVASIVTVDPITSLILTLTFFELVGFLYTFMLAGCLANTRVALFATLLLSIAQTSIRWGWWLTPTTIGVSLAPVLVYLLLNTRPERIMRDRLMAFIIITYLLTAHVFSAFVVFAITSLMFLAWFLSAFHTQVHTGNKNLKKRFHVLSPTLWLFYSIGMVTSWMFAAGPQGYPFLQDAVLDVMFGFRVYLRQVFAQTLSLSEYVVTRIGAESIQTLGILGSLFMISVKQRDWRKFCVGLVGLCLGGMTFIIQSFGLFELLPDRWVPFVQCITISAASFSLLCVISLIRRLDLRRVLVVVLILSIALLNIVAPEASFDSPLATRSNSWRFALTISEMSGGNFMARVCEGQMITDNYFQYYPSILGGNAKSFTADNMYNLNSSSFDVILLRKYVVLTKVPVFTSSAEGFMELPSDYEHAVFSNSRWNKMFSSNALSSYVRIVAMSSGQ
mgnify:CR=1 FL=1